MGDVKISLTSKYADILASVIRTVHVEDQEENQYTSLLGSLLRDEKEYTISILEAKALIVDIAYLVSIERAPSIATVVKEIIRDSLVVAGVYTTERGSS